MSSFEGIVLVLLILFFLFLWLNADDERRALVRLMRERDKEHAIYRSERAALDVARVSQVQFYENRVKLLAKQLENTRSDNANP